jgi:hypothetical protein
MGTVKHKKMALSEPHLRSGNGREVLTHDRLDVDVNKFPVDHDVFHLRIPTPDSRASGSVLPLPEFPITAISFRDHAKICAGYLGSESIQPTEYTQAQCSNCLTNSTPWLFNEQCVVYRRTNTRSLMKCHGVSYTFDFLFRIVLIQSGQY